MRIKILKTELLKKLKILSKMPRGVKVHGGMCEHVFFELSEGNVKIMVYDGQEIYSVIKLDCIEAESGVENLFSMDLKLMLSIVNKVSNTIDIMVKEKYIEIKSGRTRFEIYRGKLEEIWEYQDRPCVNKGEGIKFNLDANELKKMIESVIISASDERDKQMLGVVKLKVGNEIEMSATDGYRASISKSKIENWESKGEIECLLLKESMPVLIEMLGSGEKVVVRATNNAISLDVKDMTVTIRTREMGRYPDVKKLLSNEGERVVNISKKEWVSAINGIGNLGANLIKIKGEKDTSVVTISGESDLSKLYEVSGEIYVKISGDIEEDTNMLFRNKMIIEGIASINSEDIEIRLKGENDFITVKPKDDNGQINIILPCRNI